MLQKWIHSCVILSLGNISSGPKIKKTGLYIEILQIFFPLLIPTLIPILYDVLSR